MFVNLYVDFCLERPDIYEVRYGKPRVVKKMVERAGKMQIFSKFPVKSLIPVRRRTIHANKGFKTTVYEPRLLIPGDSRPPIPVILGHLS